MMQVWTEKLGRQAEYLHIDEMQYDADADIMQASIRGQYIQVVVVQEK